MFEMSKQLKSENCIKLSLLQGLYSSSKKTNENYSLSIYKNFKTAFKCLILNNKKNPAVYKLMSYKEIEGKKTKQ